MLKSIGLLLPHLQSYVGTILNKANYQRESNTSFFNSQNNRRTRTFNKVNPNWPPFKAQWFINCNYDTNVKSSHKSILHPLVSVGSFDSTFSKATVLVLIPNSRWFCQICSLVRHYDAVNAAGQSRDWLHFVVHYGQYWRGDWSNSVDRIPAMSQSKPYSPKKWNDWSRIIMSCYFWKLRGNTNSSRHSQWHP